MRIRTFVLRLYEQCQLRNWFYTVACANFVPVGYRFATLARQYGCCVDKPLAGVSGVLIGITKVVRVQHVPPRPTTPPDTPPTAAAPQPAHFLANELMAAARRRAAENWAMARDAAALSSTTGKGN
jgi:hypothetical protein